MWSPDHLTDAQIFGFCYELVPDALPMMTAPSESSSEHSSLSLAPLMDGRLSTPRSGFLVKLAYQVGAVRHRRSLAAVLY